MILRAAVCTVVFSDICLNDKKILFYIGTIFPDPKLQTRSQWDLEEGVF